MRIQLWINAVRRGQLGESKFWGWGGVGFSSPVTAALPAPVLSIHSLRGVRTRVHANAFHRFCALATNATPREHGSFCANWV